MVAVKLMDVGPSHSQPGVDGDGLLDGGQAVLPPAQPGQIDGEVVQRRGQLGQERVGAGPPPIRNIDGELVQLATNGYRRLRLADRSSADT